MKNSYLYLLVLVLSLPLVFGYERCPESTVINNTEIYNDSISIWIDSSKNKSISIANRKAYLKKAYNKSLKEFNDSVRNDYLSKISFRYYKLNDSLLFRLTNKKVINLSIKLRDSSKIADSYWDLGNFYSKKAIKDSAYYSYSKAQKIYEFLGNNHYSGRVLLNMAIIQSDIKDYTGSEISTIKAISLLKPLKKYRHLYRCYNNLAICFDELEEYDEAFFYHNKALEYQKRIKRNNTFRENTLNNLGVSFQHQKKYKEAINYYQEALKDTDLKNNDLGLYAKLLDNLAYSRLKLNDTLGIKDLFDHSLKIRDSISDFLGIATNKLHLAEYYASNKDTVKALKYALETERLATDTKNYRELLPVLLLLSKLDKKKYHNYINQHIELNDSLLKEERAIRNKFARIRFETDEFIVENKRLNRQKDLIVGGAIIALFIGFLLFVIRDQKLKNKELQFAQQQQNANEEIYNLMISQQNMLDEGSKKEKKRISQELHDGVLSKLFGIRLLLGTLNSKNDEKAVSKRKEYIGNLQEVEEDLRNVSHDLYHESSLSDYGFVNMIHNLLDEQSKITNFEYALINDKNIIWKKVKGSIKMNLYRIVQECVQNISKYSNAKNVLIKFKIESNNISLIIEDDGIGFNLSENRKGIGLKSMQSRAIKLKGTLSINSKPQKGTSIVITVPCDKEALNLEASKK